MPEPEDTIRIREGEIGEQQPITIKDSDGALISITWAVLGDTTIIIKGLTGTTILTITNANFSFGTSIVNWTPKAADYSSSNLVAGNTYDGFVHLADDGNNRKTVAKFKLKVLES